jgi:hypothetical protein
MKTLAARWHGPACFVLAACLVYSCGEDNTTTLVKTCLPDPKKALLGTWTIFDADKDGLPDITAIGMEFEFQRNDTLIWRTQIDTTAWWWEADYVHIIVVDSSGAEAAIRFQYEFQADTLSMFWSDASYDYFWRFLRK